MRPLSDESHITVEDVAKRLMDYGFHAPTMSWPVGGTLMIEPTESESQGRARPFLRCDDFHPRRNQGRHPRRADATDNPLKNAPHPARNDLRRRVAAPLHPRAGRLSRCPISRQHKFWPSVARIDNVHGDRNLVCTCDSVEAYAFEAES